MGQDCSTCWGLSHGHGPWTWCVSVLAGGGDSKHITTQQAGGDSTLPRLRQGKGREPRQAGAGGWSDQEALW